MKTQKTRRILAVLLALVLTLGLLPTSAFAARIVPDEVQIAAPVETTTEQPSSGGDHAELSVKAGTHTIRIHCQFGGSQRSIGSEICTYSNPLTGGDGWGYTIPYHTKYQSQFPSGYEFDHVEYAWNGNNHGYVTEGQRINIYSTGMAVYFVLRATNSGSGSGSGTTNPGTTTPPSSSGGSGSYFLQVVYVNKAKTDYKFGPRISSSSTLRRWYYDNRPMPEPAGYELKGWQSSHVHGVNNFLSNGWWAIYGSSTTALLTTAQYNDTVVLSSGEGVYLIYQGETPATSYTLNFYGNGTTVNGQSTYTVTSPETTDSSYDFAYVKPDLRSGYKFLGWATDSGATTPNVSFPYTVNSSNNNSTLYAVWQRDAGVTLTYIDRSQQYAQENQPKGINNNAAFVIKDCTNTRKGYTFLGWNTDPNATAADFEAGETISLAANATLYAVWQEDAVNVIYKPGVGGKGTDKSYEWSGTSHTVKSTGAVGFTSSYSFLYWQDSDGNQYEAGDEIGVKPSEDLILTAVWDKPAEPVSAEGVVTLQKTFAGLDEIPADFSMDWYVSTYSSETLKTYKDHKTLTSDNAKTVDEGTKTLVWDVPMFHQSGGATRNNNVTIVEHCDVDGYIYTSTMTNRIGTPAGKVYNQVHGVALGVSYTTDSEAYVLTNTYERDNRTFTVIYNDGTDPKDGEGKAFPDQRYSSLAGGSETPAFQGTPERFGYTFDGWRPEVAETVTENVTYTAKWTLNSKVTADKDLLVIFVDGYTNEAFGQVKLADGKSINHTMYPVASRIPSHVDEGYKFTGWSEPVRDADGNYIVTANYAPGTKYTLYFHWGLDTPENYYDLTLPEAMEVEAGAQVDLTNVAPNGVLDASGNKIVIRDEKLIGESWLSETNWTWDCWTDGYISADNMRDQRRVTIFTMPAADYNVYAQFDDNNESVGTGVKVEDPTTVKWVDGYSDAAPIQEKRILGTVNGLPIVPMPYPADPTRTDYIFTGWSEPVKDTEKGANDRYNWTITAQWTPVGKANVTWYDENGTTVLDGPTEFTKGDTQPSYSGETPTKAEDENYTYAFKEWVEMDDSTEDAIKYKATFTAHPKHVHDFHDKVDDEGNQVWKDGHAPTCTTAGTKIQACSCGEERDGETVAALGHDFENAAWVDDNRAGEHYDGCNTAQHRQVCNRCHGNLEGGVNRAGHTYGEWVVDHAASLTETGLRHRDCADCDHVQTDVIPTLDKCTVTWYDEDGTRLDQKEFAKGGEEPAQTIENPTKDADENNTYTFNDWTRDEDAQGNVTYTATYTTVPKYTVSWKNGDDVIDTAKTADPEQVPEFDGTIPTAPEGKEFDGWEEPVVDEENKTITINIKWKDKEPGKELTVKWVSEDGNTVLDEKKFKEGEEEPAKTIEDPAKAEDATYTYTFDKWIKSTDAEGNVTYTASYTSTRKNNGGNGGGGGGGNRPVNPPEEDLDDPDVPLANLPMLNQDDHFAYIIGKPDGNVYPLGNITRAEVVTIFFRIMTEEARSENWGETNEFSDVAAGVWYNHAVCTAVNAGLIKGLPDGTFGGDKNITRAEFATIAARFLDTVSQPAETFSDIEGHWAEADINRATVAGWIKGVGDGKFNPDAYITRAEVMTLVNRMLNRKFDESNTLADMVVWPDNMDKNAWYYGDVQEATNDHDYDRKAGTLTETWTKITEPRDWSELEK